jgi:hypothetical protein
LAYCAEKANALIKTTFPMTCMFPRMLQIYLANWIFYELMIRGKFIFFGGNHNDRKKTH